MRDFAFFFLIQCWQYFIVTISMRAVVARSYVGVIITDMLIAGAGFLIIKRVAEATTRLAWCGYVLGGTTGSVIALWLTGGVINL